MVTEQKIQKWDFRDLRLEMARFVSFATEVPKETNTKSFFSKIDQVPSIDPKGTVRFQIAYFFKE